MTTILTVHGTFATGPEEGENWWQKQSPFEARIKELIEPQSGELQWQPVIWDGANSENSRRAGTLDIGTMGSCVQRVCAEDFLPRRP